MMRVFSSLVGRSIDETKEFRKLCSLLGPAVLFVFWVGYYLFQRVMQVSSVSLYFWVVFRGVKINVLILNPRGYF